MQTSRPEPAMLEALSRFLILHERCGAGFDVAHPSGVGSGRVSITCRGCGARHDYLTTTVEIEREVHFQVHSSPEVGPAAVVGAPPADVVEAPASEPDLAASADVIGEPAPAANGIAAPSPPPHQPPSPVRSFEGTAGAPGPAPSRLRGGITGARAGTVALLLVAMIAVIVAVIRLSGDDDEPAVTSAGPAGGNASTTPDEAPPAPQPPVRRTVTTQTYTLSVPTDWNVKKVATALRLTPAGGGDVAVQVYSDRRPDLSLAEMGGLSGELLQSRHPSSSPTPPRETQVGGTDALTVGVDFEGGRETAFAIAQGSLRYLLLVSVRSSASDAERREAAAVVSSFEPAGGAS